MNVTPGRVSELPLPYIMHCGLATLSTCTPFNESEPDKVLYGILKPRVVRACIITDDTSV